MKKYRNTIIEDLHQLASVWDENCPDKSFAGLTLAEFKARVKGLSELLAAMAVLQREYSGLIATRHSLAEELNGVYNRIINSVRSDPDEELSERFIRTLGYKLRHEFDNPTASEDLEGPATAA